MTNNNDKTTIDEFVNEINNKDKECCSSNCSIF